MTRRSRRIVGGLAALGLLAGGAALTLSLLLAPRPTGRVEIAPGVHYQVERQRAAAGHEYLALAVEIDLDVARVEFVQPVPNVAGAARAGHYRLQFADWILAAEDLDLLLATTPFHGDIDDTGRADEVLHGSRGRKLPFRGWQGLPGRTVWSTEPVIAGGVASHVPKQAHLVWVDRDGAPHAERMDHGRLLDLLSGDAGGIAQGVGLEIMQIEDGAIRPTYFAPRYARDLLNYRPLLGIDERNNRVFMMAFENASTRDMLDYALAQGVRTGGQLDAGNTTWLILGRGSAGVRPHAGIRGGRPIAAYLGVRFLPGS